MVRIMNMEEDVLEDLFKIYLSAIDSYNSKIMQTINDKYTIIDKSMLAVYLYIKILEDRKERNNLSTEVLKNYLLKQIIYGETGNLALEIADKSRSSLYNKVINELVIEKFDYKNRLLKELKYDYKGIEKNDYLELLTFCEKVSEIAILNKLSNRGNLEAKKLLEASKIMATSEFKKETDIIVSSIKNGNFENTEYGKLLGVALNLRDVYRYSTLTTILPENVLLHQYIIAVTSLVFSEFLNNKLGENIDIYTIIVKSLFHDFGEYKGNEIVTQVKNYNEDTIEMFKEIEENDENELKEKIGENLYRIIATYKDEKEGYVSEVLDKCLGIMKLWIEVEYMSNKTYIKSICSVYQSRFKRFKKVEKIDTLKNKEFYIDLVRACYIYVKEHLVECDLNIFLKYFTEKELVEFREEISNIKNNKTLFLK